MAGLAGTGSNKERTEAAPTMIEHWEKDIRFHLSEQPARGCRLFNELIVVAFFLVGELFS